MSKVPQINKTAIKKCYVWLQETIIKKKTFITYLQFAPVPCLINKKKLELFSSSIIQVCKHSLKRRFVATVGKKTQKTIDFFWNSQLKDFL